MLPSRARRRASVRSRGRHRTFELLEVSIHPDAETLAKVAAADAALIMQAAIEARGVARVMFATGNSQLRFLECLTSSSVVDWSKVIAFHMDEYLGISPNHPASFRRYIRERIVERVRPKTVHYLDGSAEDGHLECERYASLLRTHPLDLCCAGIGENGHLAFNDPPVADFDDPRLVKVVQLDEACRLQQVGEGHFRLLSEVPVHALTVSIPCLLSASRIVVVVPELRKANAVRAALVEPVSASCPASVLRLQANAHLYLDLESASGLT